jgi:1-acyl-sn-glycerol-3-phosphate acyltransferase
MESKSTAKINTKKRIIKSQMWLINFLKATWGPFLFRQYNVVMENEKLVKELEPPYVILANHVNTFDPLFIGRVIPNPIHYVASDANFRSKVLNFVFSLVGTIPKTKAQSDTDSIRHIMDTVKKKKGIIGLFPEGQRTWDGHILPLFYSSAKLLKLLKVPVVVALSKGGYLSLPRWSFDRRKGKVTIEFKQILTSEDLKKMSVDQIFDSMNSGMEYDESEYQLEQQVPYKSKKRAENLELALFVCPHCKAIGTMCSYGSLFFCNGCDYSVRYTIFGRFETEGEKLYFETVRDWNLWQIGFFTEFLLAKKKDAPTGLLFRDNKIIVLTGYRDNPLKKLYLADMGLFCDRIEIYPEGGGTVTFPIDDLYGIHVQNQDRLEMYFQDVLYRYNFMTRKVSAYKWMTALEVLQTK